MSQWQPIETAPKDGTSVLIHTEGPGCGAAVCFFDTEWGDEGWWMLDDGKLALELPLRGADPTHWMPLPRGPK